MEDMNFPLIITVTVELRDALNDGTGCVDA
jgi:hypothetical protein